MEKADLSHFERSARQVRLQTQAFINGRFIDAESGAVEAVLNPATGRSLAQVADCAAGDVGAAVAAARAALERGDWAARSPQERAAVLFKLADLIDRNAEELAIIESLDSGKPISDALNVDVPESAASLRWYAQICDKVYGQVAPAPHDITALIVREPIGVVGAVVPWNFPLLMAIWKVAPALAAGNSVVLKPAELTPLSSLKLAEYAAAAGVPAGVFNVVPGRGETAGQAIGRNPDVNCVAFTGSTEVGRLFVKYASESNLKRVHLECGGKSPCLVLADAGDLARVAQHVAAGILWNQGENCTASSRLIVARSIKDELVAKVIEEIKKWPVGNPLDPKTRIGAMIEPAHLKKVLSYLDLGIEEGATVALPGSQVLQETGGSFVTPAVFDNVRNSMRLAREEIFGPILSVIPFDDESDGLVIANNSDFGLAASLWTQNLDKAHRLSKALKAGVVSVNCYSEGNLSTPFGGYKLSGFGGRDKAAQALECYTETKTIWIQHHS